MIDPFSTFTAASMFSKADIQRPGSGARASKRSAAGLRPLEPEVYAQHGHELMG
jgi:hypothetical protein